MRKESSLGRSATARYKLLYIYYYLLYLIEIYRLINSVSTSVNKILKDLFLTIRGYIDVDLDGYCFPFKSKSFASLIFAAI